MMADRVSYASLPTGPVADRALDAWVRRTLSSEPRDSIREAVPAEWIDLVVTKTDGCRPV